MIRAYKFRFWPDEAQAAQLAVEFGHARWSWNAARDFISLNYAGLGRRFNVKDADKQITLAKRDPEFAWLKDATSCCLQQKLRDLDRAFKNFFEGRAGYPSPKKRRHEQKIRYTLDWRLASNAKAWEEGRLQLPKLGIVTFNRTRKVKGRPKMATVTKDTAGRYFVSFACEANIQALPRVKRTIGIDFGVTRLATLSDGTHIKNPKHLAKRLWWLRHEQRCLSRRVGAKKGQTPSKRFEKQRLRVARIHAAIADCRREHWHRLTTDWIRRYDTIFIEDLNIAGMVRNRRIARSIADAGIGEAVRQLEYKAEWHNRTVVKVDRWFPSSKRCSACGHACKDNRKSQAVFECVSCGHKANADDNAAVNIEAEGLRVRRRGTALKLVEGDISRHPCSQKTTPLSASGEARIRRTRASLGGPNARMDVWDGTHG